MPTTEATQIELCRRFGVPWVASPAHLKVGIAENVRVGLQPLNGLRHPPTGDTTGWYLWAGEHLSTDPDFFKPLHVMHIREWCPRALPFLGLPPGWRFLTADGQTEVWQDLSLLAL